MRCKKNAARDAHYKNSSDRGDATDWYSSDWLRFRQMLTATLLTQIELNSLLYKNINCASEIKPVSADRYPTNSKLKDTFERHVLHFRLPLF